MVEFMFVLCYYYFYYYYKMLVLLKGPEITLLNCERDSVFIVALLVISHFLLPFADIVTFPVFLFFEADLPCS